MEEVGCLLLQFNKHTNINNNSQKKALKEIEVFWKLYHHDETNTSIDEGSEQFLTHRFSAHFLFRLPVKSHHSTQKQHTFHIRSLLQHKWASELTAMIQSSA